MLPIVGVILSGFDARSLYEIILEFVQIGNDKYSFVYGEPHKSGNAEALNGLKGNYSLKTIFMTTIA